MPSAASVVGGAQQAAGASAQAAYAPQAVAANVQSPVQAMQSADNPAAMAAALGQAVSAPGAIKSAVKAPGFGGIFGKLKRQKPVAQQPQAAAPAAPAAAAEPPQQQQTGGGFFGKLKRQPAAAPTAPPATPQGGGGLPSAASAVGGAQQAAGASAQAAYAPQAAAANVKAPVQAMQSADNPAAMAAALGQAVAAPGALKSAVKAPASGLGGIFGKLKRPKLPAGAPTLPGGDPAGAAAAADPATPGVAPMLEPPPTYKAPVPADYKTWMWPTAEVEKKSKAPKLLLLLLLLLVLAAAAAAAWYFLLREDDETPAAPARAAAASPLAGFVTDVDGLLRISARDRERIKGAIIGVERNCRVQPGQAADDVSAVTASRRAVLTKVRALDPPDAASTRVVNLFRQSLTLSISANAGYSKWLADLQRSPGGCRNPAANPSYQAAQGINARTQTTKKAFVQAYNPLAKRFGKRTWTSLQI